MAKCMLVAAPLLALGVAAGCSISNDGRAVGPGGAPTGSMPPGTLSGPPNGAKSDAPGPLMPDECVANAPECGQLCGKGEENCPTGLYCGSQGACSQSCVSNDVCAPFGATCKDNGRCIAPPSKKAMGGNPPPYTPPGAGNPGGSSSQTCNAVSVSAKPVTPTIILIVDQSGSMRSELNPDANVPRPRWDILEKELVGAKNKAGMKSLVYEFQHSVRFGLQMYTTDGASCPALKWMDPQPSQFEAIRTEYHMHQPGGSTPTREAVTNAMDRVLDLGLVGPVGPDGQRDPIIFLLATDGKPHPCDRFTRPDPSYDAVEAEVARAYSLGIRTFVIELAGPDDPARTAHLKRVAKIGEGLPGDAPGKPRNYFNPLHDHALRASLRDIVSGEVKCEIQLGGRVVGGNPCLGTVTLNGQTLVCGDPNGWRLSGPSTVELTGAACDQLKAGGVLVDVQFPCGVDVVLL